jgi:hypothetical protein
MQRRREQRAPKGSSWRKFFSVHLTRAVLSSCTASRHTTPVTTGTVIVRKAYGTLCKGFCHKKNLREQVCQYRLLVRLTVIYWKSQLQCNRSSRSSVQESRPYTSEHRGRVRSLEMVCTFPMWELKIWAFFGADCYMSFHLSYGNLNKATTHNGSCIILILGKNNKICLGFSITFVGVLGFMYPN